MNANLSSRQFSWDHVTKGVHPDDREMVDDYVGDLLHKEPSETTWRYGPHPVPAEMATSSEDSERRPAGHIESMRYAVGAGKTPPIMVVRGTVVDGMHRLSAAARNGQRTIEAWHAD